MSATTTPGTSAQLSLNPQSKITRGHSCLTCQQRKVRCDGQKPCATCVKNKVECAAKPPSLPRRRKARDVATKTDVLSRIQRLEQELRSKTEQLSAASSSTPELATTTTTTTASTGNNSVEPVSRRPSKTRESHGQMIIEGGHSRYVENTLWAGLKSELEQDPESLTPVSSEHTPANAEGLLFSRPISNQDGKLEHPQPVHIFKLWQTCLENVNPLVKIFHTPTMQQIILESMSNIDSVPASTEALLFAIYLSAVVSLSEGECQTMFAESRSVLVSKFSKMGEQALNNAQFLKSYDMVVLQALTLFLLAMRQRYDAQSLWLLTGLAIRSGQRIGLHRESASQGFSVFDSEIRRRLWWQIIILDGISAKLSGAAVHGSLQSIHEMKLPLNVNDSDLWPTMKEAPREHVGVTEMLFTSIRCDIGAFMHISRWSKSCLNGQLPLQGDLKSTMEEKDEGIRDLENTLESKYLRYCDPSISFHLLAVYLCKSAIAQMRLAAHHPYQFEDKGASLPQSQKDMLFSTGLDILLYHNSINGEKGLRGFMWHVNVVFPFEALIYVLLELTQRSQGDLIPKAKSAVTEAYGYHPELVKDTANALYFAIGNLAIRAWVCGPGQKESPQAVEQEIPRFIRELQAQRPTRMTKSIEQPDEGNNAAPGFTGNSLYSPQDQLTDLNGNPDQASFAPYFSMESSNAMDWEYWQNLLDGQSVYANYGSLPPSHPYS
ncbi:C6 transcription factor [Phlyctema vagabunda]|uniref:C6 transcription factor n=1 Tax=Phlyctema vagabunda TaxID=108571 RepID=A0ABR4PEB5_9HELO